MRVQAGEDGVGTASPPLGGLDGFGRESGWSEGRGFESRTVVEKHGFKEERRGRDAGDPV